MSIALGRHLAAGLLALLALIASLGPGFAMSVADRKALDLSAFKVTDPHAGYFDIAARRAELARTNDPRLLREIEELKSRKLCDASGGILVVDGTKEIPRFYADRDGWRQGVAPFQSFENMVSRLAAQQVVAPDQKAGVCLLNLLDRWAQNGALLDVTYSVDAPQNWFQTESSIFAAALAYSVVRDDVSGAEDQKQRIENWLVAAARHHFQFTGRQNSCCNNHFYRRALYSTIIGVLVHDDAMFQIGISAVYSALSDAGPQGALRLEMKRQEYSAKYQVFATMHLAMIAQIAARQGYDLYALNAYGHTLGDITNFALAAMLLPETAADAANTPHQFTSYLDDAQYFAWLELLANTPKWGAAANSLLANHRPAYNRSLGGYLSLYFMPLGGK